MTSVKALPRFVRDLLSAPPRRGEGLNNWFFRTARVLHPYRDRAEIIALLEAATAGESVKAGEIERAVHNSAAVAWQPGRATPAVPARWPKVNQEQREAVVESTGGLVDLWTCGSVPQSALTARRRKRSESSKHFFPETHGFVVDFPTIDSAPAIVQIGECG